VARSDYTRRLGTAAGQAAAQEFASREPGLDLPLTWVGHNWPRPTIADGLELKAMDDTTQPMAPPARPVLPSPVSPRLLQPVLLAAGGLVLLLVGLAWDAMLHARDPGLAAEEGVFALSNPGHVLAGIGIGLITVGLAGALGSMVLAARGPQALSRPARVGLVAGAVALALVAGGTGVWAAGAAGHDHDAAASAQAGDTTAHPHGANLPNVAATDQERAQAEALWKASAAHAQQWRDPKAAAAAGFRFKQDAGAAGPGRAVRFLHVPNPAWRADGRVLDPTRPETLVYWRDARDRLALVGVMYTAAKGMPGPTVGGPITRWHTHESCRDPATRAKLGRPVDGRCPDGQVYRRSGEMMHVWFTDDLQTAFARRAPVAALRQVAAPPPTG
jgi:hypothetical protein